MQYLMRSDAKQKAKTILLSHYSCNGETKTLKQNGNLLNNQQYKIVIN